ncbi:hypothetical protein [Paenibacillus graminis]|nr:hypothetical protein [Paenibacillus graminis]
MSFSKAASRKTTAKMPLFGPCMEVVEDYREIWHEPANLRHAA